MKMANKILVTGGTGYIGSHTAVELIQSGYEVVIIDSLFNSDLKVLDNIEAITGVRPVFEKLDICNKADLKSFFDKHDSINAVIHFAAFKAVGESVQNSLLYYHNNLISLINLLYEMKDRKIDNIVFSSSCTVYGQPDVLPVTEDAPVKLAESPYGNTKQISEEILIDAIKSYNSFKGIALRYFNPIGAHPSAKIGELPNGVPNNLVPFITQTAIGQRECLQVFGNDYNTPDGSCIRDFINVVDLAKAHVIAIERLLNDKNNSSYEFFNIGTGDGVSVLELIKIFEKVSNQKLNYKIVGRRPGDVEQVWADTTKANKVLGWKAETSLEDTMLSAWNWEKSLVK
jgi:UDP-glucose 4-epimerase